MASRPQPSVKTATRGFLFGRYESFQDFDPLCEHLSLGSKEVGKVRVDCEFLFKDSKWGVLGEEGCPAGIIYLNLHYNAPPDCTLKSSSVTVSLDENHRDVAQYRCYPTKLFRGNLPVNITDSYGPKGIVGSQKEATIRRTTRVVPEFSFQGNSVGGMGVQNSKDSLHKSRWVFNGHLVPSRGQPHYTEIRWQAAENDIDNDSSSRSNSMHTAFAFRHAGQPFLMTVRMEGKLGNSHNPVSKLKFGGAQARTATLIDFGDYRRYKMQLDRIAEGLPMAMQMKNFENVPVVLPEPLVPPSFRPAAKGDQGLNFEQDPDTSQLSGTTETPTEAEMPGIHDSGVQKAIHGTGETMPTLEDVSCVLRALEQPPEARALPLRRERQESSHHLSSVSQTPAGEEGEDQPPRGEEEEGKKQEEILIDEVQVLAKQGDVDIDVVLKVAQSPALLIVLQFFASLVALLGLSSGRKMSNGIKRPS